MKFQMLKLCGLGVALSGIFVFGCQSGKATRTNPIQQNNSYNIAYNYDQRLTSASWLYQYYNSVFSPENQHNIQEICAKYGVTQGELEKEFQMRSMEEILNARF